MVLQVEVALDTIDIYLISDILDFISTDSSSQISRYSELWC